MTQLYFTSGSFIRSYDVPEVDARVIAHGSEPDVMPILLALPEVKPIATAKVKSDRAVATIFSWQKTSDGSLVAEFAGRVKFLVQAKDTGKVEATMVTTADNKVTTHETTDLRTAKEWCWRHEKKVA